MTYKTHNFTPAHPWNRPSRFRIRHLFFVFNNRLVPLCVFQSKPFPFNDISNYFALSLEDHLFHNAILELILPSEHVTLRGPLEAVNPPALAVDLSIRRGESQGVIHDSLIDEDFNLIWFVNFNCPQSAFCAVFCNTRPWNGGKKNRLPLNNGISQFLQN